MTLAERAITATIQYRLARSVVIKDDKAYALLYAQLQTALSNAWDDAMRKGITASLDRLRDLGPGKFTAKDGAMILRVLEGSVGPDAIRAAMREPIISLSDALFRVGAQEVGKATGVSIAFARPDLDALDALKRANLYAIGGSWNAHTSEKLNAVLTEYFTDGMTREQLTARMAEDFATASDNSASYWEMRADHMATKTREIGRVTGYERAGIDRVQVRAHLDAKTSTICRQMHGRIIQVANMRSQADAYIDAANRGDTEEIKRVWAMHGDKADLSRTPSSQLKATASPPYHFRCRTITVAFFGGGSQLDQLRQQVVDREKIGTADKAFVLDHAVKAGFLRTKQARAKFQRHRANIPSKKLSSYEADARALMADPSATMLLSTRVPMRNLTERPGEVTLHAVFAKPMKRRKDGVAGELVTVVELEENVIVSHHWRDNQSSQNDITPAQIVKRIWKWRIN